jgi:hypothetical protein
MTSFCARAFVEMEHARIPIEFFDGEVVEEPVATVNLDAVFGTFPMSS